MRFHLKHVERFKDRHGHERLYYRNRTAGASRVPLRGPMGSPEFLEDYQKAAGTTAASSFVGKGTMTWLVGQYYQSPAFNKDLNPRTQYVRKGILENFLKEHGDKSFHNLRPKHIRAIRDAKAEHPEAANGLLKALRQLFKFAVEYEHADANPIIEVSYLSNKSDGFHQWTHNELNLFEQRHPTGSKARLALGLLLYTGQRRGDVIKLGRQHERNGWLHFRQQKTGKAMEIPIPSPLRELLEVSKTGDLTYLVTEFGKPYSNGGFGNWFRRKCNEAGLENCSAHGLRKVAAARLAEQGCTVHEIAAITGHTSLKEVQRYTKGAEQRLLAERALERLGGKLSQPISQISQTSGKKASDQ